jgi:ABC-type proline/glycine betaine transport system permease subunit
MLDAYRYVMQHPVMVAEWITDHLCISLIAIAIGTVLGVTTGIFIAGKGRERTADVVLYFAEIMMTVPSLALFRTANAPSQPHGTERHWFPACSHHFGYL